MILGKKKKDRNLGSSRPNFFQTMLKKGGEVYDASCIKKRKIELYVEKRI